MKDEPVQWHPCELCKRRPAQHRHHIRNCGLGGAFECNHQVNILKICGECHAIIHAEGTMGVLLILSARRFGMDQSQARAILQEEMRRE
jgi:hypothetical protein